MAIAIGRRKLVVSLRVEPVGRTVVDVPEAVEATDAQLARLGRRAVEVDRLRWEHELALLSYRPLV